MRNILFAVLSLATFTLSKKLVVKDDDYFDDDDYYEDEEYFPVNPKC
jgi:hypothetical protein